MRILVYETFPAITLHYEKRLNLKNEIRRSSRFLSKKIRNSLIEEPLVLLGETLEYKLAQTQVDWQSILTLLVAIILPVFLIWFGGSSIGSDRVVNFGLIVFAVGLVYYLIGY